MSGVTVIVPVYNAEQYLEECIVSITQELHDCDELILLNDGSKDNSLRICEKYVAHNIHIIDNSNQGVSATRNCGIQRATCDYLTFVDADDYLLEGWRDIIEQGINKGTDIVFFSKESDYMPTRQELVDNILFLPTKRKLSIRAGACWYKLFKKNFIEEREIMFEKNIINGEDGLFCLAAVLNTLNYGVVKSKNFYFYRHNPSSATHKYTDRYNESNRKYIKTVELLLKMHTSMPLLDIKESIDFIQIRGLYILANRIASIKEISERKSKYSLFEQPEYLELYKNYIPSKKCSRIVKDTFFLLKKGKYDKAIKIINRRRRVRLLLRRVVKR